MIVKNIPANYTAAFSELLYTIENADESQKTDFKVYDSEQSEIIGIKRLTGQSSYRVNVACYVQRQFDVAPLTETVCCIVKNVSRLKSVSAVAGTLAVTARSWHTFGAEDAVVCKKLSDSPEIKKISPSQCDEISFVAPGRRIKASVALVGVGNSFEFGIEGGVADHNVYSMVVAMDDIEQRFGEEGYAWSDFSQMTVAVTADNSEFIMQFYRIEPKHASEVRLCWVNRYGMVDYYSAAACRTRTAHTENNSVYTENGYKNVGARTQFVSTIVSEYEPTATMHWLCELIAAPKVWIVEDGLYTPINVKSQSTSIASTELTLMEITVSPVKNSFSQKN